MNSLGPVDRKTEAKKLWGSRVEIGRSGFSDLMLSAQFLHMCVFMP